MVKYVVICLIVALGVSSSALGSLIQGQTFSIGSSGAMQLLQGDQSGSYSQNLSIDLTQEGEGGTGFAVAQTFLSSRFSNIGMSTSGLLGTNHVGLGSALGGSSLLLPSTMSADALLARARLNSLLLGF